MSEETPIGLKIMEKLFGLILIIFGFMLSFYYYQTAGLNDPGFILFFVSGIVLIVIGVFMLWVKVE
jgi:hypothetical membrane protein